MTVNAFIHTTYVCGLAFCLWIFWGKNGWFVCFLLAPFFALPYAGENAIWAINLEYFLTSSHCNTGWTGLCQAGQPVVWLGLAVAIMDCLPWLQVAGADGGWRADVLRIIKKRRTEREI